MRGYEVRFLVERKFYFEFDFPVFLRFFLQHLCATLRIENELCFIMQTSSGCSSISEMFLNTSLYPDLVSMASLETHSMRFLEHWWLTQFYEIERVDRREN